MVGVRWSLLVSTSASGKRLKKGWGSRSHITSTSQMITCASHNHTPHLNIGIPHHTMAHQVRVFLNARACTCTPPCVRCRHHVFAFLRARACRCATPMCVYSGHHTGRKSRAACNTGWAARFVWLTCTPISRKVLIRRTFSRPALANTGEPHPKSPVCSPAHSHSHSQHKQRAACVSSTPSQQL